MAQTLWNKQDPLRSFIQLWRGENRRKLGPGLDVTYTNIFCILKTVWAENLLGIHSAAAADVETGSEHGQHLQGEVMQSSLDTISIDIYSHTII